MRRSVAAIGSALFLLVGPGLVVGVFPWLITGWVVQTPLPFWGPVRVLGMILIVAGLIVLIRAFIRFAVEGFGTPMPAAAPNRLVVRGEYRYVRNPMYVAMLGIVLGQTLLFGQFGLLIYAVVVWLIPAAYVRWWEEPVLVRRFGRDYERYRRAVPAWLPRLRPWTPSDT